MTNHQNQNGPPGLEVGPRPGHHSRTGATDTNLTSTLDSTDTEILSQHRRHRAFKRPHLVACLDRLCVNCWCGLSLVSVLHEQAS
jgi:hypothetical protein